jgi:hypothetical protein
MHPSKIIRRASLPVVKKAHKKGFPYLGSLYSNVKKKGQGRRALYALYSMRNLFEDNN